MHGPSDYFSSIVPCGHADYPFLETNPNLSFPRLLALGKRLDIAAGTAIRFEPGDVRTVTLVSIGGAQRIAGGNALASGLLSELRPQGDAIAKRIAELGFLDEPVPTPQPAPSELAPFELSREAYAALYGPTVGDRVRLGDTNLWIEVERDYTHYGDECKFGGGACIVHHVLCARCVIC